MNNTVEYQPIKFVNPLIEFMKKCPFLKDTDITATTFSPNAIDGSALAYSGTPRPIVQQMVDGSILISKQANFILYLRKPVMDEEFKIEVADTLYNIEAWVEFENYLGNPPRFGYSGGKERIWADNGMYWQETKTPEIAEFMVQIHIEYQLRFQGKLQSIAQQVNNILND